MESNTTDQQFFGAEASLSEPHFDEEATLLAARPVVPLTTIKSRSLPRPWILGLALVGTLFVGIFATAIYYSRLDTNDSQVFADVVAAAGAETSSAGSEDSFSGPVAAPAIDADRPAQVKRQLPARTQPLSSSAEPSNKPVPRLVDVIRVKDRNNHADESDDLRAARKQARQERRRAEREKRSGRSSEDLLRIRDIFEGSPRP